MKFHTNHFTLSLISAAALTLTACGGGGGSTATAPASLTAAALTPVTTTVMDGLISNAQVCVDSNNDGICQTTETQGRTNAAGQVTLNVPTADLATVTLVAQIGLDATDADTGAVKTAYSMQTPAGKHSVISPLTTLVQTKIDADKAAGVNTSIETAETHIKSQMGLTATTVSVFDDYVAKRSSSDDHKKAGVFAATYVLSVQKSKEHDAQATASGTASTCPTSSTQLASANAETRTSSEKNDSSESHSSNEQSEQDEHAREDHIESNLLNNLEAIRQIAESDHSNKTSDDIKNLVPYVPACATTGTVTPTTPVTPVTPTVPTTPTTPAAPTASATAGKASYMSLCIACHTATPANNVSKILKGANASNTILSAISSNKGGMGYLSSSVNATVASNIAAYLATPGI
ncbi:MAG: hypothetical protein PHQ58_06460 [Rhodoferax sp.]|uniref:hypothetical protein n=1 Tax=Rhodoferax sp. TaxID=50421 RepID=UPI00262DFEC7|nr:hypothetical protein [Rhodoferax sp.]MDD2880060.1 hypothetical protein [Rhodoferax sp.]